MKIKALILAALISTPAMGQNIVLILVDDLRVDDRIDTPNIDAIASTGTRYTSAYASGVWCLTSRTAVMMGVSPAAIGEQMVLNPWAVYNSAAFLDIYANPEILSLPEILSDAGYATAVAGKAFHFKEHGAGRFDNYGPSIYYQDLYALYEDPGYPQIGVPVDRATADWAVDYIENATGPYFLAVGLYQPHIPHVIPSVDYTNITEYSNTLWGDMNYVVRGYMSAASYTDQLIGEIAAAAGDAHIIILSDHGFHFGEHGIWGKDTLWQETLRVPLVISSPDYPIGEVDMPVSLIDIAPTVIDMAGLPPHPQMIGMPLRASDGLVEILDIGARVTIEGDWKFIDYNVSDPDPEGEAAYNLATDPLEQTNRIEEYRQGSGC